MGVKLQILVVYAPTNVKKDATKSDFQSKLNKALKKYKKAYPTFPILSLGDFNATIGFDAPSSRCIVQGVWMSTRPRTTDTE